MRKANELRRFLTQSVPLFEKDPDRLMVFVEGGSVNATGTPGLSHECVFTLSLIILDFAGEADAILLPVLAWMSINQPDVFASPERRAKALTFAVELNNNETVDIEINLRLSERIIVSASPEGGYTVAHAPEPIDEWSEPRGELVPVRLNGREIGRLPLPLGVAGE